MQLLSNVFKLLLLSFCLGHVESHGGRVYQQGEDVPVFIGPLTSVRTQVPIEGLSELGPLYATHDVPQPSNLGQRLSGKLHYESSLKLKMKEDVWCGILYQKQVDDRDVQWAKHLVFNAYRHNWLIDELPAARLHTLDRVQLKRYIGGFPVGVGDSNAIQAYIINHVRFVMDYHTTEAGYQVVAVAVEPVSVKHRFQDGYQWDGESEEGYNMNLTTCSSAEPLRQETISELQIMRPKENVLLTYDVVWRESDVLWESRWDLYLTEDHLVPLQVHIYSITNSITVVIVLTTVISCFLKRSLSRDAASNRGRSGQDDGDEDEGKGWLVLHGDVFRPPETNLELFCVMIGTGAFLALAAFTVLLLALFGQASMANPGTFVNGCLFSSAMASGMAGYVSSRLYKVFGGKDWKVCAKLSALLFPGIVFCMILLMSLMLHSTTISPLLPLSTVVSVGFGWFLVAIPSIWTASQLGFEQGAVVEFPCPPRDTKRAIPENRRTGARRECILDVMCLICTGVSPHCAGAQVPCFAVLFAGIPLFGAIFVELHYIMSSLFMNDQIYSVFGFAIIVYLVAIVTVSEVTILMVYHRLNRENHEWWWQAFFGAGSIGFYIFAYSLFWAGRLQMNYFPLSHLLYYGETFLVALGAFFLFGSMGTIAATLFVSKLYSSVAPQGHGSYVELADAEKDAPKSYCS